jgi:PEGA domain
LVWGEVEFRLGSASMVGYSVPNGYMPTRQPTGAPPRALLLLARTWLACTFFAGTAHADPAAQARFHDELARNAYQTRSFKTALREFFLEQRISPNPRIAYNIALCFQELKRNDEAFLYFNEYLASDDADPDRRAYAQRIASELEGKTARVLVESNPPGAQIYVDRREYGSYGATPKVLAIVPGEHELLLELPGYRAATGKVVARRGEELEVSLSPVRIVGHLHVASLAVGQVVVRNAAGESVGQGALPFDVDVAPGNYEVSVRAPGYLPWTGLASVEAEKNAEIATALQPVPALTGDITVTSNIPGALVELNGEPAGFSPTVLSNVRTGTHALHVHAPSKLDWSGELEVAPEERSWLTVSLQDPPTVHHSPGTWVVAGLGGAALVTGGVLALLAQQAHSDFEGARAGSDRTVLRERGIALNTATDVTLISGAVITGAALVLYFATAERRGEPSSVSVARSKR